jgi:hypothetical protein
MAGLVLVGVGAGVLGQRWWDEYQVRQRQMEIHAKGSEVMPFDLSKTTHVFEETEEGGLQQVRAKDPQDSEQIGLIQAHLREEAERFRRGDFGDPSSLHGEEMPGLLLLQESAGKLEVEYEDLADGGQIVYLTDDAEVLNAIHLWFMGQLQDHGEDAREMH